MCTHGCWFVSSYLRIHDSEVEDTLEVVPVRLLDYSKVERGDLHVAYLVPVTALHGTSSETRLTIDCCRLPDFPVAKTLTSRIIV